MIELTNETQNIIIDCQIALDWEVYCNGIGLLMDNGEVLKHEPWTSDDFTFPLLMIGVTMTIDEIKKVREAARRLRNGIRFHPEDKKDIGLCTDLVSTVIPTDFDQPVTEEWLVETYGFVRDDAEGCWETMHNAIRYEMEMVGTSQWLLSWDDVNYWPIDITTRYQFCQLAVALGIPKKGE